MSRSLKNFFKVNKTQSSDFKCKKGFKNEDFYRQKSK